MVTDEICKNEKYIIYGAQVVAVGAYVAIKYLTGISPENFAVGTSKEKVIHSQENPQEIDGIPVVSIDKIPKDMYIVVGVTELIQKEVLPCLEKNGYHNVFPLTQHEEHLLMSV